MRPSCLSIITLVLLAPPAALAQVNPQPVPIRRVPVNGIQQPTPEPVLSDDEALRQAGLSPTDGAKLVAYLRQRTLTDADQGKIQEIIRRLGADDFDERQRASEEIESFGSAAVSPLKAAEKNSDAEIAYRATRALKKMEKISHASVAAAAVRAVVRIRPTEAVPALIGFLPLAETEMLAEEIREALKALAYRDGKPESGLIEALTDKLPLRRSAAYVALIEGAKSPPKAVVERVAAAVGKEIDVDARFCGLFALVTAAHAKDQMEKFIASIPEISRGRIWQLEDFLLQLAKTHPEGGRFGKSPESLDKARDAWAKWWAEKSGEIDLAKFEYKPRIQGYTDMIELDQRGYNQGRVVSYGPTMKERWKLAGVTNPTDARLLPNGHVLLVEQGYNRVTERDFNGKIITSWNHVQPIKAELLPDGGLLVIGRVQIVQFDKNINPVFTFSSQGLNGQIRTILGGRRLPNGDTVYLLSNNTGVPAPNCFVIDGKGKEKGTPLTLGRMNVLPQGMDVIGENKILVCEMEQVAEYELETGKKLWSYAVQMPNSVQRLPNGNTLIACLNANKAIEVDPSGEVVWEYQAKDGLRVARAYRR